MQTFLEYVEARDFENSVAPILTEIAHQAENNPILNDILMQEGWWDNVKNWWNNSKFGQATNTFLQGAWSGAKSGAQAAASVYTGPLAQFKNAIRSLSNAAKAYNDPTAPDELKKSTTTGTSNLPAMPLGQWLSDTVKELESQVGQLQNKSLTKASTGYGPASQPGTFTDPAGNKYQQQVVPGNKNPAPGTP